MLAEQQRSRAAEQQRVDVAGAGERGHSGGRVRGRAARADRAGAGGNATAVRADREGEGQDAGRGAGGDGAQRGGGDAGPGEPGGGAAAARAREQDRGRVLGPGLDDGGERVAGRVHDRVGRSDGAEAARGAAGLAVGAGVRGGAVRAPGRERGPQQQLHHLPRAAGRGGAAEHRVHLQGPHGLRVCDRVSRRRAGRDRERRHDLRALGHPAVQARTRVRRPPRRRARPGLPARPVPRRERPCKPLCERRFRRLHLHLGHAGARLRPEFFRQRQRRQRPAVLQRRAHRRHRQR